MWKSCGKLQKKVGLRPSEAVYALFEGSLKVKEFLRSRVDRGGAL